MYRAPTRECVQYCLSTRGLGPRLFRLRRSIKKKDWSPLSIERGFGRERDARYGIASVGQREGRKRLGAQFLIYSRNVDEQTRRMGAYIIETESQLENVDLSEIGVESGDCRHYSHRVRSNVDEQTRRMGAYIIETESQLENVDLSEIGVESGDCRHYSHRVRSAPDGDYYLAPTYSLQPRLLESTLNLILFAKTWLSSIDLWNLKRGWTSSS